MHDNSMKLMEQFVEDYDLKDAVVIDIGSQDFNGSYRDLFSEGYIGADIVKGVNVDVIVGSVLWDLIGQVDAIISGQTLEHVEDIPALMVEIYGKLKPGGAICMIAPSDGPPHNYPMWAGHFSVERMKKVVSSAGFKVVDCKKSDIDPFKDVRCIAIKPKDGGDENK